MSALPVDTPGALPRSGKTARIILEQLVAGTASEFGARYLFENDPDGSYGFFNRVATEAADASTPVERDRLIRLYGGRWALAEEGEEHPLFRPITGMSVAGRRLVLYENPSPLAELRWAGRAWSRASLSGALDLARSERFQPETDVDVSSGQRRGPFRPALHRVGRGREHRRRSRGRRGRGRGTGASHLLEDVLSGLEGPRRRRTGAGHRGQRPGSRGRSLGGKTPRRNRLRPRAVPARRRDPGGRISRGARRRARRGAAEAIARRSPRCRDRRCLEESPRKRTPRASRWPRLPLGPATGCARWLAPGSRRDGRAPRGRDPRAAGT